MEKIDKKIVSAEIVNENSINPTILRIANNITEMDNKKRPSKLNGSTYKILINRMVNRQNYYITINDIEENGNYYPFEIFIVTSDTANNPFLTALSRLLSALFKLAKDLEKPLDFIIKNLTEISSYNGGYYDNALHKHITSIPCHIGHIIKAHCEYLDKINNGEIVDDEISKEESKKKQTDIISKIVTECHVCGKKSLVKEGGCEYCTECGYDKGCG